MPNHGEGPIPARILLVGEAWGENEEREGRPFVGASGAELNRMLQEAGILRSECFVTNLINKRPPNNDLRLWIPTRKKEVTAAHVTLRDRKVLPLVVEGYNQLQAEIQMVQPNVIVAFGNYAMWALTGKYGVMNWRGSLLGGNGDPKVIPTIHPAAVLREWSFRAAVVNDLRRVEKHMHSRTYNPPAWKFIIRPTYAQVLNCLSMLHGRMEGGEETWLDFDIETRSGHIECFSLSWSRTEAICVPLMSYDGRDGYWSMEEEAQIIYQMYRVCCHKNARVRWQNGLYDAQYTHRWWHFIPRGGQDTMISQHTIWSDLPKALHYQASIYADWYVFWKEEGKLWNPKMAPEQRWNYNCLDCVYTREVGEVEQELVAKMGLRHVHEFQQAMFWPVLRAMTRGIRVIEENSAALAAEIQEQISIREAFLFDVLGFTINTDSPKQMMALFYEDLAQPVIFKRGKKGEPSRPTCDDEALTKLGNREPILRPITSCIADLRTLGKFLSDFILAKRDTDRRMRCSFNIGGSASGKSAPKTYRLSSSENAFGSGANLQTIPSEKSKSVGKWEQRQHFSMIGDPYSLPNLRSMFGPDPGYTFFDMDLERADLYTAVWEADDAMLKAAMRLGTDIHLLNAYVLEGKEPPPLEELIETHARYSDHRGPMKYKREFAKVFCHGTNYGGGARTMAQHTGRSVAEVDRAQKIWFGAHPGIRKWHERVQYQINRHRFIENRFGYRWYIFDRLDAMLPEAIAWIPQSTTSIVINKIWMNFHNNLPEVEVLLQVHDSLAGQFPTHRHDYCVSAMKEQSKVTIPYDDPLVIPTGLKTSVKSWGDC